MRLYNSALHLGQMWTFLSFFPFSFIGTIMLIQLGVIVFN